MIKKIILTVSFVTLISFGINETASAAEKKKCFALKNSERSWGACFKPILGDPEVREQKKAEKAAAKAEAKETAKQARLEKEAERQRKIDERKAEVKRKREELKANRAAKKAAKKAAKEAAKGQERKKVKAKIESCEKDPSSSGCKKDQIKSLFKKLKQLGGENIGDPG